MRQLRESSKPSKLNKNDPDESLKIKTKRREASVISTKGKVNMYNFTDEFWNEVRNRIDYLTSASNGLNELDDIEVEELVILRLLLKNYSKEV